MTAFLRLNGIVVPAAEASEASLAPEAIGKMNRSATGQGNSGRRLRKGGWKFSCIPDLAVTAIALRELVAGEGHVLSFDASNPYTSQGMAPVAFPGGWGYSGAAKYGLHCALSDVSGAAATWAFFASGAPWTIAYWLNEGSGYHHVITTSAGGIWLDGLVSFSLPSGWNTSTDGFNGVTGGVASFGSTIGTQWFFDDLVALPYVVPDAWPPQMYGFGSAFGLLPALTADGLFIEQNTKVSVLGGDAPTAKVMVGGGVKNLHAFSFELSEV